MPRPDYLNLPDPNDPRSIDRHKTAVFSYFSRFFDLADSALKESTAKAKDLFGLLGGPRDRAVHAMNTRYLVKVALTANQVAAEEQEPSAEEGSLAGNLNLEWVANCGIYVRLPEAEIRILKFGPGGVPKSTSPARSRYYSSNQMLLAFDERQRGKELRVDLPLALVLLWDIDEEFRYLGLEIACPRTVNRDGDVDCFWMETWTGSSIAAASDKPASSADTDLDEITAVKPSVARANTAKS